MVSFLAFESASASECNYMWTYSFRVLELPLGSGETDDYFTFDGDA